MLAAVKEFHFADACRKPELMHEFDDHGRDEKLIDILRGVSIITPIAVKYLRPAAASTPTAIRRVLQSFFTLFARLE